MILFTLKAGAGEEEELPGGSQGRIPSKQEFHLEQGRYCHLPLNAMSLPQVHAHLLKDRRERDEQ